MAPHHPGPVEIAVRNLKFEVLSPKENHVYYQPVLFKVTIPKKSGKLFLRIGKKNNDGTWNTEWMLWQVTEDKFIDRGAFYQWEETLVLPPSDYYFIARPQYIEYAPLGPAAADKDGIQFRVASSSEKPHISSLDIKNGLITLMPLHGNATFRSGESIALKFRHAAPARGFHYQFQHKVKGRWVKTKSPRALRTITSKSGGQVITTARLQVKTPGQYRWRCRAGKGPWSEWQTFTVIHAARTTVHRVNKSGMHTRFYGAGGDPSRGKTGKALAKPPRLLSLKHGQVLTAPATLKLKAHYTGSGKLVYELLKNGRVIKTNNSGKFTNLPAGHYTVRVRADEPGAKFSAPVPFVVKAKLSPALMKTNTNNSKPNLKGNMIHRQMK